MRRLLPSGWRDGFVWLMCVFTIGAFSACGGAKTIAPTQTVATTGPVSITVNLATFSVNDAIGVTILNTSSTAYYTQDGKSACTIAQLERYDTSKGLWVPVDRCLSPSPAQVLVIPKGAHEPFTLAPTSPNDLNAWQSGLYRVTVAYTTQVDGVTGQQVAWSAAFNVR